jgi:ribosomal-protein-alanine N-acetyltransferase
MGQDDVDRIMAVMQAAFPPDYNEAWSRRQVEDALLIGNCHYILCDAAGDPPGDGPATGFALLRGGFGEEELLLFAVLPEARGRGAGTRLLARALEGARGRGSERMLLEMRRGNSAESLYRKAGFVPVGLRPNYYRTTGGTRIDAITFSCPL